MTNKIAEYKGNGWDSHNSIEVSNDGMYTIFKIQQYGESLDVKIRNVPRPEAQIQFQINRIKNGRRTITSFSIPAKLSELFIKAVSEQKK